MNPWPDIKHLFETDDGSLPDIYIDDMSDEQIVMAYEWLMSQCRITQAPMLWSIDKQASVPIREIESPAREFVAGKVGSFRHGLSGLDVHGVSLPELTVSLESGCISFDYRMGADWDEQTVTALFELLCRMRRFAPQSRVFQADEGSYSTPNQEFSEAFERYYSEATPNNASL